MQPGTYPISTPGNATFTLSVTWKDSSGAVVNLTGYSAAMQVQLAADGTPVVLLTTGNGMIVLGSTAPNIVLTVPVATMETLTCPEGKYDLVVKSPGGIQTALLVGPFVVEGWITP